MPKFYRSGIVRETNSASTIRMLKKGGFKEFKTKKEFQALLDESLSHQKLVDENGHVEEFDYVEEEENEPEDDEE